MIPSWSFAHILILLWVIIEQFSHLCTCLIFPDQLYIIGWINSDDYYDENIFGFVCTYFNNNPDVDMIYGSCNIVDQEGRFVRKYEEGYGFKKCKINDFEKFNYDTLLNVYSGLIPQQSVFFRSSIFSKAGYLDESFQFTMDYEYWLRIAQKFNIQSVDNVLANFRIHSLAKTNYKNMFAFISEASRARNKYGGRFLAPINYYKWIRIFKTTLKILFIKLGLMKDK